MGMSCCLRRRWNSALETVAVSGNAPKGEPSVNHAVSQHRHRALSLETTARNWAKPDATPAISRAHDRATRGRGRLPKVQPPFAKVAIHFTGRSGSFPKV